MGSGRGKGGGGQEGEGWEAEWERKGCEVGGERV